MPLPVGPPLKPMLAKLQEEIPRGDGWIYEPKWDGFRTVVFRDGNEVTLRSRNDRPLNRYFPEVEKMLLEGLPDRCVVDGEIIMPTDKGLDFDGLQNRLHPAASRVNKLADDTPASFVAFDLMAHDATSLMDEPLSARQAKLDALLDAATPKSPTEPALHAAPCLFLTPRTTDPDEAQGWFVDLERVGCDGLIAKRADLRYQPDVRAMIKIKHRRTADCVVIGYRTHKNGGVGSLLLGVYDNGQLRFVGHTSSFSAKERKELVSKLEPLRTDAPEGFDTDWGPGGQSRWSQGREGDWNAIEQTLVCEVSYDYVTGDRFRHAARFHAWREDKDPQECLFDQLRY
jgi:ATP-dependent DNA ligase